jgi:hypothetical protein
VRSRRKFFILGLAFIFTSISFSANAATVSQGVKCKKINQISKLGKQSFICSETILGKVLVKNDLMPTKTTQMKEQALAKIEEMSLIDLTLLVNLINDSATIQTQIDTVLARNIELKSLLVVANSDKNIADQDMTLLPTSIAAANAKVSQAQSATTTPYQNYLSLITQLNSLSYEYNSAFRAKSAYLTCSVLNTFGFQAGGCGYYNSYYDIVISKYNSLSSQVDAAKAIYDFYQSAYTGALKEYNDLVGSRNSLGSKSSTLITNISRMNNELSSNLNQLSFLTSQKNNIGLYQPKLSYYQNLATDLSARINTVLSGKSSTWLKNLAPIYKEYAVAKYELSLILNK